MLEHIQHLVAEFRFQIPQRSEWSQLFIDQWLVKNVVEKKIYKIWIPGWSTNVKHNSILG